MDEILHRFLAEAAVGGGALLLAGPAGIGRTALLDAAAAHAEASGAFVVRVTGVEDEADLAGAALDRLITPLPPAHREVLATRRPARAAERGSCPQPRGARSR